jgi:hypothetical protein
VKEKTFQCKWMLASCSSGRQLLARPEQQLPAVQAVQAVAGVSFVPASWPCDSPTDSPACPSHAPWI